MSIYNEMVWSFHAIECVKQQEAYTVLVGVQLALTLLGNSPWQPREVEYCMQSVLMLEKVCVLIVYLDHCMYMHICIYIYEMGSCVLQETYTGEFPEDLPSKYQKHIQRMWVVVILGKLNRQSMFYYITHAAEPMRSESKCEAAEARIWL